MGPKKVEEDEIRQLINYELNTLLKKEHIVRIYKSQRIRWYDLIHRKNNKDPVKIITE